MEKTAAIESLAALAHDTRLDLFRRLVRAGPAGVAAGELARSLGVRPNTLSFHLNHLSHAGLVASRREGRLVIYRADYNRMNALVGYLTRHCCEGERKVES